MHLLSDEWERSSTVYKLKGARGRRGSRILNEQERHATAHPALRARGMNMLSRAKLIDLLDMNMLSRAQLRFTWETDGSHLKEIKGPGTRSSWPCLYVFFYSTHTKCPCLYVFFYSTHTKCPSLYTFFSYSTHTKRPCLVLPARVLQRVRGCILACQSVSERLTSKTTHGREET